MKKILFVLLCIVVANNISAQGITKNGEIVITEASFVNRNGAVGFTGVDKNGKLQVTLNSIGQFYLGGLIGYILQTGDPGYDANVLHGLIITAVDIATNTEWGCQGTFVGANNNAFGAGPANTTAIVNGCGTAATGAKVCNDLVLNGYSDWFLPSRDELNKIYLNRAIIGGFSHTGYYWSSSECNGSNAVGFGFDNGDNGPGCGTKGDQNNIRAVRIF